MKGTNAIRLRIPLLRNCFSNRSGKNPDKIHLNVRKDAHRKKQSPELTTAVSEQK